WILPNSPAVSKERGTRRRPVPLMEQLLIKEAPPFRRRLFNSASARSEDGARTLSRRVACIRAAGWTGRLEAECLRHVAQGLHFGQRVAVERIDCVDATDVLSIDDRRGLPIGAGGVA